MTNQALVYRTFGPPSSVLRLEASPLTALNADLRVEMIAAPVNPSDLLPITGAYRQRVQPPRVAGYEGIGTVIATGPACTSLLGQRVLPLRAGGTWQRYIDMACAWAVPVPPDLSDELAARGYINPLTAMLMLHSHPPRGRRIVVTAGGSSCSRLLVQWAVAAGARNVACITRSAANQVQLAALGAQAVLASDAPAVAALAREADVVFDAVGGSAADAILAELPAEARFVQFGQLSGRPPKRSARVELFHLRTFVERCRVDEWHGAFAQLLPLLATVALPRAKGFSLSEWPLAVEHSLDAKDGKALIVFSRP